MSERPIGASRDLDGDLAAWGKVIILETRGRRSGMPRPVFVGFVETSAGLLIAASDDEARWARNLLADPHCQVELRGRRRACIAVPLAGAEREAAVVALILKYGTPSERLGSGPAFRLEADVAATSPGRPR